MQNTAKLSKYCRAIRAKQFRVCEEAAMAHSLNCHIRVDDTPIRMMKVIRPDLKFVLVLGTAHVHAHIAMAYLECTILWCGIRKLMTSRRTLYSVDCKYTHVPHSVCHSKLEDCSVAPSAIE